MILVLVTRVCVCVCVRVCVHLVISYSRLGINLGKAANLARGQSNRENILFPVPVRASSFGLARQVRPSCSASSRSFSTPKLNLVLINNSLSFLPLSATTASIHTVNHHRASPEFIGPSRNCVPFRWRPPRIRRNSSSSSSSSQNRSSKGCYLFRKPDGPFSVRSFFSP